MPASRLPVPVLFLALPVLLPAQTDSPVNFSRDIRPILSRNCFPCHGPDAGRRKAKLRLDERASATRMRGKYRVVEPRKPEDSELMARIGGDVEERMPPPRSGKRLTPDEVALIRSWIAQGAPYARHWSLVRPRYPPLPAVERTDWPRSELDRFVLAALERRGLEPAAEADRYTLIRRLSLDLTGLPPEPAAVRAFVDSRRPDAYERLVDRLLASSAFGEHQARVWLDLARYADSKGYGSDPLRTIWPWRDWVVRAFNDNMPFDRFTTEQLAGDLLPDATQAQRLATAFHRNTMTNTEGGTDDEEFRVAAVKDRAETTMQVWMGLTLRCAQCHDHRFDPLSQEEYYRFYAFFNQTADADRHDDAPRLETPTPQEEERLVRLRSELGLLETELRQLHGGPRVSAVLNDPLRHDIAATHRAIRKMRPTTTPVMAELPPDKRRQSFVHVKGNFLQRGKEVQPGVPEALHPWPAGAPLNRLGVARWLLSDENPLTARVTVNRFWSRIFGRGLVETEEDFGSQGSPPTHPRLLDWLALQFRSSGWDVKALLRTIVTSATYRQESRIDPAKLRVDPRNLWLARGPRIRLEAETLRDQALALGGLLSKKMFGPPVFPSQPKGLWQAAFNQADRTWPTSSGEDRHRRGLYTFLRRTIPYPSLATFDMPSREVCTLRRISTNTPLQAFVTLNDPAWVEAASGLARRVIRQGGRTPASRGRFGLFVCLQRPPEDGQVAEIVGLYEEARRWYAAHPGQARKLLRGIPGGLPHGTPAAEAAAWVVVANVLLNLDAVLMKG